ncbi:MAG: YjjG family noncanonical pyrimidine nucleotidase [Lactobacillales bacterium]|jgi:2-haloacid dehalogenase|nr:YjjG family noncanonical pyrimidine nucleotidase [Lactobacillales bacterium]
MKYLLFDVDNTLLDFDLAEEFALRKVYEKYAIDWNEASIDIYKKINQFFWQQHEQGKITRKELFADRFPLVFQELGKEVSTDGLTIDDEYRQFLSQSHEPNPGSYEMLDELKKLDYELYVVTNGAPEVSLPRLQAAKMENYFKDIFVSEVIGSQKPQKEFFDYVFDHIPNFHPEEATIIGDTLSSDILGGKNAGISTVWYNPKLLVAPKEISPDYQIHHLMEIFDVLGGTFSAKE